MAASRDSFVLQFRIRAESGVTLAALAEQLQAVQHFVAEVARALAATTGARFEFEKEEVEAAFQLEVLSVRTGSIELETVRRGDGPRYPELDDLVQQTVPAALRAISEGREDYIAQAFPQLSSRLRVLRAARPLFPVDRKSVVEFAGVRPTEQGARFLESRLQRPEVGAGPAAIVGRLYFVNDEPKRANFRVKSGRRSVTCYYERDQYDVVRDLIVGSTVEVIGQGKTDSRGGLAEITGVESVRTVSEDIIQKNEVIYEKRCFRLASAMLVEVYCVNKAWIYAYQPLGILAYASSREEARNAFGMEFAACWDEIAEEDDVRLTAEALSLKRRMRRLVDTVEKVS